MEIYEKTFKILRRRTRLLEKLVRQGAPKTDISSEARLLREAAEAINQQYGTGELR